METFDNTVAERLGGVGIAVRLTRGDGGSSPAPAKVTLDYSSFGGAYPGGFASRLTVLKMPTCMLEAKPSQECLDQARSKTRALPVINDVAHGKLSAIMDAAPASMTSEDTSVYALASSATTTAADSAGSFAATDLKPSGTWQVGLSGGDFSYSYPVPAVPAPSGDAPKISLQYSSSSVDSLTSYTNNQPPLVGVGWQLGAGLIERQFAPCDVSGSRLEGHLCWESPDSDPGGSALTLSVGGRSSQIVKDTTSGTYKTDEDYGWKIEYVTSGGESGQPYWKVTTQDGTRYRFGFHRDSSWQVPVLGDDAGEPCHAAFKASGTSYPTTAAFCAAPWRWQLDQEIDPKGNVIDYAYARETNTYCRAGGHVCTWVADYALAYDRGGYLSEVTYGHNVNVTGSAPTGKITISTVNRGTPPAGITDWNDDTPSDLLCDIGGSRCGSNGTPTFFTTKRLDAIITSAWNPVSGRWDDATRLKLSYKWILTDCPDSSPFGCLGKPVLWLDRIQPVGMAGGGPALDAPPADFTATLLDNRADYVEFSSDKPRFRLPRITAFTTGLGGVTEITYGQANPCDGGGSTGWDDSGKDCYAWELYNYTLGESSIYTNGAIYNKWLVTKTVERDLVAGSPDQIAQYQYVGRPAWAKPVPLIVTPRECVGDSYLLDQYYPWLMTCPKWPGNWTEFRGYQTVRVIKGTPGGELSGYSVSATSFYRGLYDDVKADGTAKHATVADFDGIQHDDLRVLSGRTLHEQTMRVTGMSTPVYVCSYPKWQSGTTYDYGAGVSYNNHHWKAAVANRGYTPAPPYWTDLGPCPMTTSIPDAFGEEASTRYEYENVVTGSGPRIYNPHRVDQTRQVSRENASSGWRYTEVKTEYDADGLPVKVNDYGERGDAGDNTCTTTTYARNTSGGAWMISYKASEEKRAGDNCSSGALLGRSVSLYDGSTSPGSNTPTRGNVTETRSYSSSSDYSVTKATYDHYGRPLTSTDPLGKTTTTTFTPAVGWPNGGVTVTNPLGHTATTWSSPYNGQPVGMRDANNNDVNIDYDALGRTLQLWTPVAPKSGGTPAAKVAYNIPVNSKGAVNGPVWTTVSRLQSGSGGSAKWLSSHTYIDGLGRTREVQTASPAGGRIVQVTTYDARGLTAAASAPVHNTAAPGSGLLNPTMTSLRQWSQPVYDGLGRTTAEVDMSGASELRRTTTNYLGVDKYEVIPPVGGKTVYYTDAADQVTKIEEWLSGAGTGQQTAVAGPSAPSSTADTSTGDTWPTSSPSAADAEALAAEVVAARTQASAEAAKVGKPVEVPSMTSATSSTVANTDGSFTTSISSHPVRMKRSGKWTPIETTLVEKAGVLVPKVGPKVEISTGGSGPFVKLTDDAGRFIALSWPTELPRPKVKDNTATYADALGDGADLVVTALETGFSHDVVLRKRPAAPVEIRIPVESSGMNLVKDAAGGLRLTSSDGAAIALAPAPVMWDSSAKAATQEPRQGAIATSVESQSGRTVLVLKPDEKFLSDAATVYPVIVDPTLTANADSSRVFDSDGASPMPWVIGAANTDNNGTRYVRRSLVKFDTNALAGVSVQNATLTLYRESAFKCLPGALAIQRVTSSWSSSTTWNSQPTATTTDQATQTDSLCPMSATNLTGSVSWTITGIAQAWASGATNYGVRLIGTSESGSVYWRNFHSHTPQGGSKPKLEVTYTLPSAPEVSGTGLTPSAVSGGTTTTSTLTPTLHATVSDPAGGNLRADYEIEHDPAYPAEGTGSIWTGSSASVTSGSEAVATVPSGKLTDGWHIRWRARATNTGASTSSAWSAWQTATIAVPDPVVDELQVTPSQDLAGVKVTSMLTPALAARVTTSDGAASRVDFELEHDPADTAHGTGSIWTGGADNVASGAQGSVTVPTGKLSDGWKVRWRARAVAPGNNASAWTAWQALTVTVPAATVTQLQITPSQSVDGTTKVSSLTPQLLATVSDSYGAALRAEFEVEHDPSVSGGQGSGQIWTGAVDNVASGTQASVVVPGGKLSNGWKVRWRARAVNTGTQLTSPWSDWQLATIDVGDIPADPAVAALQVAPSHEVDGVTVASSLTPQLLAQVTNPAGGNLRAEFELEHDPAAPEGQGSGQIWTGAADNVPAGTQASAAVPEGTLSEGWLVRWRARATAGDTASEWSDWNTFRVDLPDPEVGALQVTPSEVIDGVTVTSTLTPRLLAQVTNPAGGTLRAEFEVEHDPAAPAGQGSGSIWTTAVNDVASGTQAAVTVPEGKLTDGWQVRWRARGVTTGGTSAWSEWQKLTVTDGSRVPVIEKPRTQPVSNGKTTTLTPALLAKVSTAQGSQLGAEFEVEHDPSDAAHGTGQIWTGAVVDVASDVEAAVTVPAGKLADGWKFRWRARAVKGLIRSEWTAWQTVTVQVPQHYDTSYEYDRDGRMTKQTDANGNVRTFTYDLLGRRVASHDPDAGDSQQAYDAVGRLLWSSNGKGQKVSYSYDDFGRKTVLWSGEAGSGTKLAEWLYDTVAKGELTSATRYVGTNAYVDTITSYDAMGRATGSTLTIPSSEGLLAGTYTFTTKYTTSGALAEYGMPAAGGLPAEKVTSTYSDLDLPQAMTSDLGGGFTYVASTTYSPTGRLAERGYGAGGKIKRDLVWDDATGWLKRVTTRTKADTSSPVTSQDDQYFYDISGEITRILDAASAAGGSRGQSECFTYDGLHRLAQAWTTTASTCGTGTASADNLGIDPYAQSYAYDEVGNLTSLADAGQTATYTYPAPGASATRPNAVTSITRPTSTDTYGYDDAGQLTSRNVERKTGTFAWNEIGQLEKATIEGQDTTMVYDASGERLIRRDPGGKATLYLGSMEIEVAASTITGKRYYTAPDGATIAMRDGGSGVTWLMSGLHGSTQLAIKDANDQIFRERYLPFGQRRGTDDLPFTDHGFLGKIEDDSTKLTYLSARYYDPAIAKFISTDPLLALSKPQWGNPYSYSGNNPVGFSDPSGLKPIDTCQDEYRAGIHSAGCLKWAQEQAKKAAAAAEKERQRLLKALASAELSCSSDPWGAECSHYRSNVTAMLGYDPFAASEGSKRAADLINSVLEYMTEDIVSCHNGSIAGCVSFIASFVPGEKLAAGFLKLAGKAAEKLGPKAGNIAKRAAARIEGKFAACVTHSFVSGTQVLMADGTYKAIEQVQVGDQVLVTDPVTGKTAIRPVAAVIVGEGEKTLVRITVDIDGDKGSKTGVIIATSHHPFWVSTQQHWFNADQLASGMRFRGVDSTSLGVLAVSEYRVQDERVYNLTISGFHTYYVSAGGASVLVHNANPAGCNGTFDASPKHGRGQRGNAAPGPKDGQTALDNSVGIGPNTTRRVGIDKDNGEFVIFDETHPGQDIYHGHVRKWSELSQQQKNALIDAGLVTRRGKML
ncbi:polymorphic toxin-type HINT domain-containing protein [Microtetraspora malaysiensis]|uniref:Polymorphic toxin-type HINT domain-containing protein n=1 Tax=Microtetraspora malaysiensis TaxID=161358 RepID=A0ABW6SY01_9ACTN